MPIQNPRNTSASLCVTGLMSGTSLDGVDIAVVRFKPEEGWAYELLAGTTVPYSPSWKERLQAALHAPAGALALLHAELGTLYGQLATDFLRQTGHRADLIASHGHTVFHNPAARLTFQAGHPAYLAAAAGLPVVADFRTLDVALGGQGAPLVPIGDRLLFGSYDYCLNLGGFANISFERSGQRLACDTGPCNMALNALAEREGREFDAGGAMARSGSVLSELLERMNAPEYFKKPLPKSLGREWYDETFRPLLAAGETSDLLRTCVEHIAMQVAAWTTPGANLLITGGGAYNEFLIERITALTRAHVTVPADSLIQFKEAIVFALLGALRWRGEINCLASVTGAARDSSGGVVIL